MANLFLDDFTDKMNEDILYKRKCAEEAESKGKYSLAEWYKRECDTLWYALMQYYLIVLKRRRFLSQQIHAAFVLENLDQKAWTIWTSRKKRKKKDVQTGNDKSCDDKST